MSTNNGKIIVTLENINLSSPQGILLKNGISGGRLEYENIIITIEGIRKRKESINEIFTN